MGIVLAIANQKGGVGKTTTAINLAASLGEMGQRVLLVDMDPQGNASIGSGIKLSLEEEGGIEEALLDKKELAQLVRPTAFGYQLLPSNAQLTEAEIGLINRPGRQLRLQQLLTPMLNDYDYILIDCPPSLSLLTVNSLVVADGVLVPVQCEYYALEGLVMISEVIQSLKKLNRRLTLDGMLRTMYTPRSRLAREVSSQLEEHFQALVYRSVIPRSIRLAEAPGQGQPAIFYDRYSKGAQAYLNFARELLERRSDRVPKGRERIRTAADGKVVKPGVSEGIGIDLDKNV